MLRCSLKFNPQSVIRYQQFALWVKRSNSNLIWRTVSNRVDEVIPSDHQRRIASRVIQWYGLHPRDMMLYARSSYYYDKMFIICLFSDFLILKPILVYNPEILRERLP